jgi:hypothetical protein
MSRAKIFNRYIQLRPQDPLGYYALGTTLETMQRTPEAAKECERSHSVVAAAERRSTSERHLVSRLLFFV